MKPLPIGAPVVESGGKRHAVMAALSLNAVDCKLMYELNEQFGIIFDRGKVCQGKSDAQ
jgi:hypothetical protein